jgi:hypothetical protein
MQHDFILLDRSGSMKELWAEALSSVNAYVKKLAEDKVDTGVTLAVFDGQGGLDFKVVRDRIIPSTWHPVTSADAEPRGMTPLNDATGRIVSLARAGNYDKVAIIIMTDGHENDSKELSVQQARSLLDDCRTKGWQVIFLGADFDNAAQADSYNNDVNATMSAVRGTFAAHTHSVASKRAFYGATGQSMSWTDAEKAELAKKTS